MWDAHAEVELPVPMAKYRGQQVFIERAAVRRDDGSLLYRTRDGAVVILPIAMMSVLFLGQGCSITTEAIDLLSSYGVSLEFVTGMQTRAVASVVPLSTGAKMAMRQARLWADDRAHLAVVQRMYDLRFGEGFADIDDDHGLLSKNLNVLRGREGQRIRRRYRELSEEFKVQWDKRTPYVSYDECDRLNKALHVSHSLLRGLAHSIVRSMGLISSLGFIHVNSQLALSMDIADIFQTKVADLLAFSVGSRSFISDDELAKAVRVEFYSFAQKHALHRQIIETIVYLFGSEEEDSTELWEPDYADDLLS